MRERHRLFLDIMRLANRLGVEFAFPTQTIHLAKADQEERPAPSGPRPRTPAKVTAGDSLASGRSQAKEIARQSLGDPASVPPPFEFPKV